MDKEKLKIKTPEEICEEANKMAARSKPVKEAKNFSWYILPLKKGFKFSFKWRF